MQARTSSRVRITAHGSAKSPRGATWDIQFDDLSEGGCRVDDPRHGLELGAVVKLTIAGTGPHHSEVAWRQGDRVGLEFMRPISEGVFSAMAEGEWDKARELSADQIGRFPIRRVR